MSGHTVGGYWGHKLDAIPVEPGVYLFRDRRGQVIYVGKAKNIQSRVRQYFSGADDRLMIPYLLQRARDVEAMVVRTEKEALILENTLIKRHRPRYNSKLVDDSNFLHLRVDPKAPWPRYELVRQISDTDARYFGPFASASRARATLEFLQRRFPLRTCTDHELRSRSRPCLLHQMGRCIAPCVDLCTEEEYGSLLGESLLFLEGRNSELVGFVRKRMMGAAAAERFEEAARLRDLLKAIEASIQDQDVADRALRSRDVWGLSREGASGVLALLPVRRGMVQDAVVLPFSGHLAASGDLLSGLLNTWYGSGREIPAEILLPLLPSDVVALGEVLTERRGRVVKLLTPQRGLKARQLSLAMDNARSALLQRGADTQRRTKVLRELQRVCRIPRFPHRIECFDNSNLQGTDPVAGQVVFIDGLPARALYRRYRVKTVVGADDYASMHEILGRRLRRGLSDGDLPDLVVVDGGKGQLNAALTILDELGFASQRDAHDATAARPLLPVIGLAKARTEHARGDRHATDKIVLPGVRDPVRLSTSSPVLRLLQTIRDETHDTAVRYHRRVRRRRVIASSLDQIPGLGPVRRRALLTHFGSVRAIQAATPEAIAALPGFGPALSQRILTALAPPGPEAE